MFFNILWNILLGIAGGVISSVIVSRVFLIQGEYQQQVKFVNQIVRKLGAVSTYLAAAKVVLEVSYDQDVEIEKEMKENGYSTEDEYYAAHKDNNWVLKDGVLSSFRKQMLASVNSIKEEISNAHIEDTQLSAFLREVIRHLDNVAAIKEFTFSSINNAEKDANELLQTYNNCKHMTGKQLLKLILKDKVMMVLYIMLLAIIVGTIVTYLLGV